MPLGDLATKDHREFRRLPNGPIGVEQPIAERVESGAAVEDRVGAVLDLSEAQPVRADAPLGRGEEWDERSEPLLPTAFEFRVVSESARAWSRAGAPQVRKQFAAWRNAIPSASMQRASQWC